jgi:hypothetical protein
MVSYNLLFNIRYNTVHDAYKELHDVIKKNYSTGLDWNPKGDDKAFENLK